MITGKVKKQAKHKGYIIAVESDKLGTVLGYHIYTLEEWNMGNGLRYPEWEGCGTLQEAIDWIG